MQKKRYFYSPESGDLTAIIGGWHNHLYILNFAPSGVSPSLPFPFIDFV